MGNITLNGGSYKASVYLFSNKCGFITKFHVLENKVLALKFVFSFVFG